MLKSLIRNRVKEKWTNTPATRNWWTSPDLAAYVDRTIHADPPYGVVGALQAATGGAVLGRGISVGSGKGDKERALLASGCVETIDAFELSEERTAASRKISAELGLQDRMKERVANAFEIAEAGTYDLVYWDHSLHHMFDIDKAVAWSLEMLRPGGYLIVNEYIGPTRLQTTRDEVRFARDFIRSHVDRIGVPEEAVRYSTLASRMRQLWRDPSEAPYSTSIPSAFERHIGASLGMLGGVAIHLLAPIVIGCEPEGGPLTEALIEWDIEGRRRGLNHFGFGIARK